MEKNFEKEQEEKRKKYNRRIQSQFQQMKDLYGENGKEENKKSIPKGGKAIRLNLYSFSTGQDKKLLSFFSHLLQGLYPTFWEELSPSHFAELFASILFDANQKKESQTSLETLELPTERWQRLYYRLLRHPDRPFLRYFDLSPKKRKISLNAAPLYYLEILLGKKVARQIYSEEESLPSVEEIEKLCDREGIPFHFTEFVATEGTRLSKQTLSQHVGK